MSSFQVAARMIGSAKRHVPDLRAESIHVHRLDVLPSADESRGFQVSVCEKAYLGVASLITPPRAVKEAKGSGLLWGLCVGRQRQKVAGAQKCRAAMGVADALEASPSDSDDECGDERECELREAEDDMVEAMAESAAPAAPATPPAPAPLAAEASESEFGFGAFGASEPESVAGSVGSAVAEVRAVGLKRYEFARGTRSRPCFACGGLWSKGDFRLDVRTKPGAKLSDVRQVHPECCGALPEELQRGGVVVVKRWLGDVGPTVVGEEVRGHLTRALRSLGG